MRLKVVSSRLCNAHLPPVTERSLSHDMDCALLSRGAMDWVGDALLKLGVASSELEEYFPLAVSSPSRGVPPVNPCVLATSGRVRNAAEQNPTSGSFSKSSCIWLTRASIRCGKLRPCQTETSLFSRLLLPFSSRVQVFPRERRTSLDGRACRYSSNTRKTAT